MSGRRRWPARRPARCLAPILCCLAPVLAAQEAAPELDLTLPPTIESPPGEPRLEPAPEQRDDVLEAVVTGGQRDWRLPDLGSDLRQQREDEAAASTGRIEVGFLGLYDPEEDDANEEFLSPDAEVERGVGFLKFFEIEFGGGRND